MHLYPRCSLPLVQNVLGARRYFVIEFVTIHSSKDNFLLLFGKAMIFNLVEIDVDYFQMIKTGVYLESQSNVLWEIRKQLFCKKNGISLVF